MIEAVSSVARSTLADRLVEVPAAHAMQQPSEATRADFTRTTTEIASQATAASHQTSPATSAAASQLEVNQPRSIDAAAPIGESDVAKRIAQQAESLAEHLRSMDPRSPLAAPKSVSDGSQPPKVGDASAKATTAKNANETRITDADKAAVDANIVQMEHAYVFAIEATLASHGSTEATKIFNTLLRGQ